MDFTQIKKRADEAWLAHKTDDPSAPHELSAFSHQVRVVSRNWGLIDPENIDHYIANDGYCGLAKALTMTPEEVLAEIAQAGLRGRGGAGFATAEKWRICHDSPGCEKYVICNAAEGDPQAHSIRMLLESDPHAVLEGILIAAFAVGAGHAYIHINAEHALAVARVRNALKQAGEAGLAGEDILGSGFNCRVELHEGPGDFVAGVETAMIRGMEGERLMSYIRPPYPATSGLHGKPTCVNSAETLAYVSIILAKGAEWYASAGFKGCRGTKLITLDGPFAFPGVAEVLMGTPLSLIVREIGGGLVDGRELKSLMIGGPAGGILPMDLLDLPYDFDSLAAKGAMVGSGRITAISDETCMVEMARSNAAFLKKESCGKCVLCREGSAQLLAILTDITVGKGKTDDIELMQEIGEGMQSGSICGLGQTAANPVLGAIAHYQDEIEAHIKKKRCPALVCRKFITYHILGEKCQGCQACGEQCPEGAIAGEAGMIHVIDQDDCTRCGTCMKVCPVEYGAVVKAGGVKPKTPDEPIPVGSWRKR